MEPVNYRQLRGLVLAWRHRPDWINAQPAINEYVVGARPTLVTGISSGGRTVRYNNYQRVALPAFGPLKGKGVLSEHRGRCRWCQLPIRDNRRELWHYDCLPAYWAATGQQSNLTDYLRSEHGDRPSSPACAECGAAPVIYWNYVTDLFADHRNYLRVHQMGAPWQVVWRSTRTGVELQLDHHDALSVAWASGDQRRLLRALTLNNLRWLCRPCHSVKTGVDRKRMNNLLNGRPENCAETAGDRSVAPQSPSQQQLL